MRIGRGARRPAALIALLALAGLGVRLALLSRAGWRYDYDEGMVGLQVLRILRGARPVFHPGQPYLAALESYLIAPLFACCGANAVTLKLVPWLLSGGYVATVGWLGLRAYGRRVGVLSALLAACAPVYLLIVGMKTWGATAETLLLGNLALLSASYALEERSAQSARERALVALGAVGGVAFWVSWLIAFYALPIALVLVWRGHGLWRRRALVWAGIAFLAGSAPFWAYNVQHAGATFRYLLSDQGDTWGNLWPILRHLNDDLAPRLVSGDPRWHVLSWPAIWWLQIVYEGGLMMLVAGVAAGALPPRPQQGTTSPAPPASRATARLAERAPAGTSGHSRWVRAGRAARGELRSPQRAAFAARRALKSARRRAPRRRAFPGGERSPSAHAPRSASPNPTRALLALFALLLPPIYVLSGYGNHALNAFGFDATGRYVLMIHSVLPIGAARLAARVACGRMWRRWLGAALVSSVVALNLLGAARLDPVQGFASPYYTRQPATLAPLIEALEREGIRYVWTDVGIAHVLMFETGERVLAADWYDIYGAGGIVRFPEVPQRILAAERVAFVEVILPGQQETPFERAFRRANVPYRALHVSPDLLMIIPAYPVDPALVADGLGYQF